MGNFTMKIFLIIMFAWIIILVCFGQEQPDSTKKKLKKIITKQEKQTEFDSLMIKIAKEDSIKQSKKKK